MNIFIKQKIKLAFNDTQVKQVNEPKYLGLIIGSKLTFDNHINENMRIVKIWIRVIKNLSPHLSVKLLDQIYAVSTRTTVDHVASDH